MKVKQPRRWKKHTVQEQGEISNRFSGRILWAMLLLGGIGTLIALGISGGSDCRGTRKTHISMGTGCGNLAIPYSVLEELKKLR